LLHQRYKDFSPCLIQGLLKVFFPGKSGEDLDPDKNSRAMKKRSTMKLLVELYFVGIVEDASIFVNIMKDLTSLEHLKDREVTQTNLSLLSSFVRQGRLFIGLQSHGHESNDEVRDLSSNIVLLVIKWSPNKMIITFDFNCNR
jgi:regulator of nonsense transcripts 2